MLTKKELEMRRTGIGASEIAAVLGVSRWRTPMDVWLDKTGRREPVNLDDNPAVYWGHRLEEVVAEEFRRRNGVKFKKQTTTRHPDFKWMLATPDRLIVDKAGNVIGGLEVKTAGVRAEDEWGEEGTDDVPLEYICQCIQNMLVFGLTEWNLAVLIAGRDYREYKIPLSPTVADNIKANGTVFWIEHVQANVPPPARSASDVAELYSKSTSGKEVEADALISHACTSLALEKEALDRAEQRVEALQTQIKAYMEDADTLKDPFDGTVLATWKTSARSTFDAKALKASNPEVFAKYQVHKESRTFLLKVKTGE